MPRPRHLAPAALALLALGGCVEQADPLPQVTASPRPTARTEARFPVNITRSGGVAGFTDHVSVQKDGEVLASTKQGQVSCTLDEASLATLNEGALQIHDGDRPAPGSDVADGMSVLISSGFGMVGVDDPKFAAAAPVVAQLLADLAGPAAERRLCR